MDHQQYKQWTHTETTSWWNLMKFVSMDSNTFIIGDIHENWQEELQKQNDEQEDKEDEPQTI